jgi:hypothetical protein
MATVEADWPLVRFGAVGDAWRLYRSHWGTWSLTALVSLVCIGILEGVVSTAFHVSLRGAFGGLLGLRAPEAPIPVIVVGAMIVGFFLGGMVRMAIRQVRGRAPRVEDLFAVSDVWFDLVLGSALLALIAAIGLSLFVLPGLVALGLFMFMYPLIVDGGLPATGALIQSFHALKSQWLLAASVHFVMAFIAGLGVVLFGIGWLVTCPLYVLTLAVLYHELFLDPHSPRWAKPKHEFDEF